MGGTKSDLIILPDTCHYDLLTAEVIAVGPGDRLEDGSREPIGIVPGDKVICWQGYGVEVEKNVYFVDISEIDAKVIEEES